MYTYNDKEKGSSKDVTLLGGSSENGIFFVSVSAHVYCS